MHKDIKEYLLNNIRSIYKCNDKGHDERHFDEVFNESYHLGKLAKLSGFEMDMLLIAAAYHDVGYIVDRKDHAIYSENMFNNDRQLWKLIEQHYPAYKQTLIRKHISNAILIHDIKEPTDILYCQILKDADKCSIHNKCRFLYRICSSHIDKNRHNYYSDEQLISDSVNAIYDRFNGYCIYEPKSFIANNLYDVEKIEFTKEDIKNSIISILNE